MTGLSAGQHRLEFVDALEFGLFGDGPKYAAEWWDDRESFDVAERITVTPGETAPVRTLSSTLRGRRSTTRCNPRSRVEARRRNVDCDPGRRGRRASPTHVPVSVVRRRRRDPGADKKTFIPNSDHLGQVDRCRVMAERNNAEESRFLGRTDPVAKGVLTPVTQPTILSVGAPRR